MTSRFAPVSGDLTSGCTGAAPNGARGCFISTVGLSDGGTGVYAGTDEGWIQVSPDAVTADSPTWRRTGAGQLPNRPVNQIAVDRSNWRIAYAAYGGFNAATPRRSGHVFATTNGGGRWTDISANLPDVPVDSIVLDPSDSKTLYAGTDVGAFVSTNAGHSWKRLGSGMPKVAVWQLDYDASHGVLAAGTHGRGAYTLQNRNALPALVVSKVDSGVPVGPGRNIDYTVTVKNLGNAAATGVTVRDPVPARTTLRLRRLRRAAAQRRRRLAHLTIPAGGSVSVTFTVTIASRLPSSVNGHRQRRDHGDARPSRSAPPGARTPRRSRPRTPSSVDPATAHRGGQGRHLRDVHRARHERGLPAGQLRPHAHRAPGPPRPTTRRAPPRSAATATVQPGASADVCVKVAVPGVGGGRRPERDHAQGDLERGRRRCRPRPR